MPQSIASNKPTFVWYRSNGSKQGVMCSLNYYGWIYSVNNPGRPLVEHVVKEEELHLSMAELAKIYPPPKLPD